MIRIGKGIAGTLSAVALVLGASVASYAQSTSQPSDTSKGTTAQPSDTSKAEPSHKETGKGATSRQAPTSTKETAQERMDREKVTLKDRLQEQVSVADANIDALKKMKDSDKGTAKKRDEDMEKKISDLKDHLQKDVDKIDKATPSEWSGVHPAVQHDLNAMEAELRTAEKLTKVPAPRTGAANKQPSNPAPAPSEKH